VFTGKYLLVLLSTLAIEIIVALIFGYRNKRAVMSIIFVNLITNPLTNYFLWLNTYFHLFSADLLHVIMLEILVVCIEWGLLVFALRRNIRSLLPLALTMNSASFIVGFIFLK